MYLTSVFKPQTVIEAVKGLTDRLEGKILKEDALGKISGAKHPPGKTKKNGISGVDAPSDKAEKLRQLQLEKDKKSIVDQNRMGN